MFLLREVLNILVRNASPRGPMCFRSLIFNLSGHCELLFLLCFIVSVMLYPCMLCVVLLMCLFVCVCCVLDSVCELFGETSLIISSLSSLFIFTFYSGILSQLVVYHVMGLSIIIYTVDGPPC